MRCDERESVTSHILLGVLYVVCGSVDLVLSLLPGQPPLATTHATQRALTSYLPSLYQPTGPGQHDTVRPFPSVIFTLHCSAPPPGIGIFATNNKGSAGVLIVLSHFGWHRSNKEIINQEFRDIEIPAVSCDTDTDQDI